MFEKDTGTGPPLMQEGKPVWEVVCPLAGGFIPVTELRYDKGEECYFVTALRTGISGRIMRQHVVAIWEFEDYHAYYAALKTAGRRIEVSH